MVQSEIDAIRALLSSKPRPVGWLERRQRLDEVGSVWPVAEDIALSPVDAGGVPAEWSLAPGSDASRVLMFFHGGGYCSGSIRSHRRMVTEAGRAAGMRTLAIGYRLAPEHPFPSALEDARAAWRFVITQGVGAAHVAVAGDSAGGGLSVTLINTLRSAGEQFPACAWLVSPWTDLTMSGPTLAGKDAVDPLIHKDYLNELADAYVPGGLDRKDPRVSPLYADLRGLPPCFVCVGTCDHLLDDSLFLAARAAAAGVDVELVVLPDLPHAFQAFSCGITKLWAEQQTTWLQARLA